ncbi:MAG TPA: hypothetical protein VFE62_03260 [Gemmataceae bacterium]|nr:hypothetical protein [Gemmataceae bacterium]
MKRIVIVSAPISRAIRGFGLPREVMLELLTKIHNEVPAKFEAIRSQRMDDDRYYRHRMIVHDIDSNTEHLFVLAIDDTTSSDHLIIANIGHGMPW